MATAVLTLIVVALALLVALRLSQRFLDWRRLAGDRTVVDGAPDMISRSRAHLRLVIALGEHVRHLAMRAEQSALALVVPGHVAERPDELRP